MCAKGVNVSRRTGLLGLFLGPRVLVFVNNLSASSILCTLKISASALEVGVEDIFGTTVTQFSSTVSEAAAVYVRRRCQPQQLNWPSWMIFGSQGPSFGKRFLSQQ